MIYQISENLLFEFCDFVTANMGLYFPKERWMDLERGIHASAQEFNFKNLESYIHWLMSRSLEKSQIEILASYLTVGETYFFREKKSFKTLEEHILPEIIHSRRGNSQNIRIWSAGCCTGEETYSIAIMIHRLLPDLKDWNITIIGTDINPKFLIKASDGVYSNWSFRDLLPQIKEKYFKQRKNSHFEIIPEVKKMVNFSYLNLAEDVFPSLLNNTNAMDIIFCRNVLMYFSSGITEKVIQNFYRSLVDSGWLVVSLSELSLIHYSNFVSVNFNDMILYKKDIISSKTERIVKDILTEKVIYDFSREILSNVHQVNFDLDEKIKIQPDSIEKENEMPGKEVDKMESLEPNRDLKTEIFTLIQENRFTEAMERVNILLSKNPEDPNGISIMSRILANQGRLKEALEWCEKSIYIDKLNPEYYFLRAEIFQERNEIDEAIKSLKKTLYLDQNFVLAHFALGNLAQQLAKFEESNKHFKNVISLLQTYSKEESLPGSDGITAGRLFEIVNSIITRKN
jgi:chemotaxis protein methyltransferase CheR